MTMTKKKLIICGIACACIASVGAYAWHSAASATKIAFINYQPITLGEIGKANDNKHIKIINLPVEKLDNARNCDMIFLNGMGLRITEEQRKDLKEASENGLPVLSTAVTNPQNLIESIDSADSELLKQYLQGGGKENYRSMLNFVRKFIDGKKFFIGNISDPLPSPTGLFYHPDPQKPDSDMIYFQSLPEYEQFLSSEGLDGKNKIILTGQMGVPDELIAQLEATGNTVYATTSLSRCISMGIADAIGASAVINMAHGRLGDSAVDYLKRANIPLFAPLNVNRGYTEWMADKTGMNGGYLSQSVVTPEIDGAIRPWSLFAMFEGEDGVPQIKTIPGRLEEFVTTVNNYISLQQMKNSNKKVAVFYFKGPGQNALTAEGMDVAPSLYNMLKRLKSEGYKVDNLPASAQEFEKMINERGKVFGSYVLGAMTRFIKECSPIVINTEDYLGWFAESLSPEMASEIVAVDGDFPGSGLHTDNNELAIAALQFGNIVLIPQTAAGLGDDDFKIVHGTDMAPPHAYVASYLWAKHGFGADALVHFGTHGSLEFTPRKQVALGSTDWSDRLIGTLPHFYLYATSNVGEAMTAKRRSYAGIINYLTPPFMESNLRSTYKKLTDAIHGYSKEYENENPSADVLDRSARLVKKYTVELGIHRELRLDSVLTKAYTADEIARIENFAEELANEKITGSFYTMGEAYSTEKINSTVFAMSVDPIAYSLYALDKQRGIVSGEYDMKSARFTACYLIPAQNLVRKILTEQRDLSQSDICRIAGITEDELTKAIQLTEELNSSKDFLSKMMVMSSSTTAKAHTSKLSDRKENPAANSTVLNKMSKNMAAAIMEIKRTVENVSNYSKALRNSPEDELNSVINALAGGYIPPSSGGDPVLNPEILPTGRNMFAINAEETPSETAWEKGKSLVDNTLKLYREAHNDSLPRKVSYTLWSSEFIETEGATIAQILYMLGVEPLRDPFGRVTDLRLIPSTELGRPRIDVVVQTSGQLRDLAATRLFLINRAVEMAANAKDEKHSNFVKDGVIESEKHLVNKGIPPKEARELSTARVFGGVNGSYGTGIQEMVEAGDRWEDESGIADTYLHNMGAIYTSEHDWEKMREYAFEAALTGTDAVVQPRQSNTWGALSLDHVYEFMGGLNLAVRTVTGKDPDAYLADYRNRNRVRMQEVKEAIGVESRTTVLNPTYIKEKMKGGASDAASIADVVRNTYGWNVMKPDVIDNELWNNIYDTYISDVNAIGTKEYFRRINPAALQEITAVMLETARKGLWQASEQQLNKLAEFHTEMVSEFDASCSSFVCDNAKLSDYIASKVDAQTAKNYKKAVANIRNEIIDAADGMVMKKEQLIDLNKSTSKISGRLVAVAVAVCLIIIFIVIRRRKDTE